MIRSYFEIAIRQLLAHKAYSAINIIGFATGLACFIMMALFVRHEWGYDRQWPNAERIYRISRDYYARDGARAQFPAQNAVPAGPALREEFPEIEQMARVIGAGLQLKIGDVVYDERRVRWADGALFEIFHFDWLAGDPATALREPNSIVLTEALATKYFGTAAPMGLAVVDIGSGAALKVTGVIRNLSEQTHLSIDGLASLDTFFSFLEPEFPSNWNVTEFHTYFLLRAGASVDTIERRLPEFLNRRIGPGTSATSGMTIMNVRDIHMRSTRDREWKPAGNVGTVYAFSAIALLILVIACINFTNLSTARSDARAREVGVRKSLGATRRRLVAQFLGESVLTAALAMLVAVALAELVLPAFGAFTGTDLRVRYFGADGVAYELAALTVIVGVLAGGYAAFYLSAFEPAKVLKGDCTRAATGMSFRNILIVVQFAIAIALIAATAVIDRQMSFAQSLDLGFDKDQIFVMSGGSGGLGTRWPAIKQQLLDQPGVLGVTASYETPFQIRDNPLWFRPEGTAAPSRLQWMAVDYDFFETYKIGILAGRGFSPTLASDALIVPTPERPLTTATFVINESAARQLGWSREDAVGRQLEMGRDEAFGARAVGPVVGIVADTYFESVRSPVKPMVYALYPQLAFPRFFMINNVSIRLAPGAAAATRDRLDALWREFFDHPFPSRFLDVDYEALYQTERHQGRMLAYFSALAVIVACLGLFGLASYTTERRTKEIGVRKVMGGTVWDVVYLLTADYAKLVLLASVVGCPLAYFAMRRWLESFAYRAPLSPWTYVGGAALALLVASLTVGVVAARAAAARPLGSLRHE